MFGSDILDIIIGMVSVYLLLSLICSGFNEMIEVIVKNRAKDLERGIAELIGDPEKNSGFLKAFYNHGLINSLFKGNYPPEKTADLPSYIPAENFALAVMDLAKNPPAGVELPKNLKSAVALFEKKAAGQETKVQANLENWFNSGMDRVSGWYKRRSQWILIALGLVAAIGINADSIRIAQAISNSASLRQGLVASIQARGQTAAGTSADTAQAAGAAIDSALTRLDTLGLPLGWEHAEIIAAETKLALPAPAPGLLAHALSMAQTASGVALILFGHHILGWLLTAVAISMGAPFWFDLLNKLVAVRSALKPEIAAEAPQPAQTAAAHEPVVVTQPLVIQQPPPVMPPSVPFVPPGTPAPAVNLPNTNA